MKLTKRILVAVLVALALSGGIQRAINVVVSSQCANLTPDDTFLWWWFECGKDTAGGGGSGAGD